MDQLYNFRTQYQLIAQFLDQQGHFLTEQTPALTNTQCQQRKIILRYTPPPVQNVNINRCVNIFLLTQYLFNYLFHKDVFKLNIDIIINFIRMFFTSQYLA